MTPADLEKIMDELKALNSTLARMVHGDEQPTGLEALAMSLSGEGNGRPVGEAIDRLADAGKSIAEAIDRLADTVRKK